MKESSDRVLEELQSLIRRCVECRLHQSRQCAVAGEGPAGATVLLIGEAPGRQEDSQGRPFVGPAGKFLNQLLDGVGLSRDRVFITNSVKCRPPDNRRPREDELAICRKRWLDRQIDLVDPEVVVLMGKAPLQQMFQESPALRDVHGQLREQGKRTFLITYHPAAGKRFPSAGRAIREDFAKLKKILEKR